ncbi:diacylglycerol kinase family protein [Zafaria sp. Z1313]|uniref:diacylglycerol/lipid kinase family protein n=1 Tax=unclassified Zafaria TaxID=2828765 RepID=UPI002E795BA3|nr:diacylglycerol kinase family protein [Zafaria sp. J156]MEE1621618.1 diacylglycerol kinase family protein [Zafaria sp. J156]
MTQAPRATRSFSFLVNPSAGAGSAQRAAEEVAEHLRSRGASVEVVLLAGPGQVGEGVESALDRGDVVVCAGGDGTLSSIAGEVARRGGVLGVVPAGRGNDFARMLGLPRDAASVARILLEGAAVPTDLLRAVQPDGAERIVAGSVYAGVDARTAELVNRMRRLPRRLQYPLAAIRSLATFRASRYVVEVDGVAHAFGAACVVVANSAFYGSGMRIAPSASVEDGELDVVVIGAIGRLDMLRSFPKVYSGAHVGLGNVHVFRGRSVAFSCGPAMPLGADGEPLGQLGAAPVRVDVLPGAVRILR